MKKIGKNENLDTELNLVPIIDSFIILICFLLFTAAFTQLVYIETKITQNTVNAMNESRDKLDEFHLTIELHNNEYVLDLKGSRVRGNRKSITKLEDGYDYKTLHNELIQLKTTHPERFSIDIAIKANNKSGIKYEYIAKTIDTVRHLTDEEYKYLRVAEKKLQNLELSEAEQEFQLPNEIIAMAESIISNDIASKTDPKVLFPDISLVGVY